MKGNPYGVAVSGLCWSIQRKPLRGICRRIVVVNSKETTTGYRRTGFTFIPASQYGFIYKELKIKQIICKTLFKS